MKIALMVPLMVATAAAAEPPVAVRLSHLHVPVQVRERLQAHADQGITSLARYLELTRTVYQLRLMDVVVGIDAWGFAGDSESVDRQIERDVRERDGRSRGVR